MNLLLLGRSQMLSKERIQHHNWRFKMLFLYLVSSAVIVSVHAYKIKLFGFSIRGFCLIRILFGVDCPFCGVTRAVYSILNLNLKESLHYHPLGLFVFFTTVVVLCYFIVAVLFPTVIKKSWYEEVKLFKYLNKTMFIFLLGFWIVKNIIIFRGGF